MGFYAHAIRSEECLEINSFLAGTRLCLLVGDHTIAVLPLHTPSAIPIPLSSLTLFDFYISSLQHKYQSRVKYPTVNPISQLTHLSLYIEPIRTMNFMLALFVLLTVLSLKSAAQPDATAFIRCPNECGTFSEALNRCTRFIRFGCTIVPCIGGQFRCDREGEPLTPVVTPGEPITFTDASIFESFKFMVNFSVRPVQSDLYLLSDATGSIRNAIDSIRDGFNNIVSEFSDGTDAAFGVGFYRDELSPETDNGFVNLQSITTNIPAATSAINSLEATGGGDPPEANLVALHRLATDGSIGWRPNARKIIVYFGDRPGHEPTCDGGETLTRGSVIMELEDITVVAVSFGSQGLNGPTTKFGTCSLEPVGALNQANDIVTGTGGGNVIAGANQGQIVEEIMEALRNIPRTFDLDTSDCDEFFSIVSNPTLPVTVNVGDLTTVDQMLTLNNVCDLPAVDTDDFSCMLRYTETGAELPVTPVRFLNIMGCEG